jgi:hypothetical protein
MGVGVLDGITEMDLSGINFVDITDLEPLYVMDELTDLWLVDTENLDATDLDVLLDNLTTIEGTDTEGILYMTQADYDAFNAPPLHCCSGRGRRVAEVGSVNRPAVFGV